MSWLSEIAGKAEDLLNKVDKTTAVVLQNKQSTNSVSSRTNQQFFEEDRSRVSAFDSRAYSSYFSRSPSKQAVPDRGSRAVSVPQTVRKVSVSDDEKLLEYLNSSEPVSRDQRKKGQPPKLKKHNAGSNVSGKQYTFQDSRTSEASTVSKKADVLPPDLNVSDGKGPVETSTAEGSTSNNDPPAQQLNEETTSVSSHKEPMAVELEIQSESSFQDGLQSPDSLEARYQSEPRNEHSEHEHRNPASERGPRERLERESDLIAALDAKDSQIAVLKVRLEEADQEIRNKNLILEELKVKNERLLKESNDGICAQAQVTESLRTRLADIEAELSKTREEYHSSQNEHLSRMSKMDEEKRQLAENITNLQKKIAELSERNRETSFLLQSSNRSLESLQQEYNDYKQKAQRILQSKEKLIASLKEGCLDVEKAATNETSYAVLSAETEGIKQERDLLREELRKAMDSIESYRNEVHELEKMAQSDSDSAREHCRNLEEQLQQERMLKEEVQHLNAQLKEEISYLQEEVTRTKNSLNSRIQDREMEIEKLRKQLMAKSLSTVSQDELESRLHALTENLIHKQTIVEALSTEKNSLVLQLERLEQQLKEAQVYGMQNHSVIGVSNVEPERKPRMSLFMENPLDSNLTRKVKRVYSSIDAFSIRLGVFFRRYPVARLFIFVYMLLLHMWVMIVLLTYEPEIHGPSYKDSNN